MFSLFWSYLVGFYVNQNLLEEVAQESGILEINDDYVTQQFRENRERITLCPETVEDAELV